MRAGKVPPEVLGPLLERIGADPSVVVGPGIGLDAAVLRLGDRLLVAKSDPITLVAGRAGWHAVHVNANDVACMGGTPRWFLATCLLPKDWDEARVEGLFEDLLSACQTVGVALVGGHMEVTQGIDRPIVCGHMLGEIEEGEPLTSGGAQPGDAIVVTKGVAIEGTAALARELAGELRRAGVDDGTIAAASSYLERPGISVVKEARLARKTRGVTSLHDPTEGGLITGLRELAEASRAGLVVEAGAVPVLPECRALCAALGLDPLGLLASGALLITVTSGRAEELVALLEGEGVPAFTIGHVTAAQEGLRMVVGTRELPLPSFTRDELARALEGRGELF